LIKSESYQWKKCSEGTLCLAKASSTSSAVPKVVALAGLVWKLRPSSKPEEIKKILLDPRTITDGELNPSSAIQLAKELIAGKATQPTLSK